MNSLLGALVVVVLTGFGGLPCAVGVLVGFVLGAFRMGFRLGARMAQAAFSTRSHVIPPLLLLLVPTCLLGGGP